LLERRPDIAAAERRMASANAQIGVAKAAYYPTISLGAAGGFESGVITTLISGPSILWSAGGSAVEPLLTTRMKLIFFISAGIGPPGGKAPCIHNAARRPSIEIAAKLVPADS
jgi:Outer membrane efflux protein